MLRFESVTSKTQQKNCNLLDHDFCFLCCSLMQNNLDLLQNYEITCDPVTWHGDFNFVTIKSIR